MVRKLILCLILTLITPLLQSEELSSGTYAAVADGITTHLGLSVGAVEINPLLGPHPSLLAILGITTLKIWYSESIKDNENDQKIITGIWAGGAANNLAIIAGVGNPIIIGIAVGVYFWKTTKIPQKNSSQ